MNQDQDLPTTPSAQARSSAERFALRVVAHLSGGAEALPYEIAERLRAARVQALALRRRAVAQPRTVGWLAHAGAARGGRGGEGAGWWNALVSAIPLLALLVGLVLINSAQDERSARDVAEVDAALLTDDLPPAAYADPGFVQFLKTLAPPD